MNKLMFKLVFLGFFSVPSWAFASSTVEEEFCTQLKSANAEMEGTLLQIKQRKRDDSVFLTALNNSQKQWVQYVDAEVLMQFPSQRFIDYGSVLPMCQCITRLGLTQERITTLKQWLEPVVEGDVCTGSKR